MRVLTYFQTPRGTFRWLLDDGRTGECRTLFDLTTLREELGRVRCDKLHFLDTLPVRFTLVGRLIVLMRPAAARPFAWADLRAVRLRLLAADLLLLLAAGLLAGIVLP